MEASYLIYFLIAATLGAVIVFALRSKSKVEDKLDDPNSEDSALATDDPKVYH